MGCRRHARPPRSGLEAAGAVDNEISTVRRQLDIQSAQKFLSLDPTRRREVPAPLDNAMFRLWTANQTTAWATVNQAKLPGAAKQQGLAMVWLMDSTVTLSSEEPGYGETSVHEMGDARMAHDPKTLVIGNSLDGMPGPVPDFHGPHGTDLRHRRIGDAGASDLDLSAPQHRNHLPAELFVA